MKIEAGLKLEVLSKEEGGKERPVYYDMDVISVNDEEVVFLPASPGGVSRNEICILRVKRPEPKFKVGQVLRIDLEDPSEFHKVTRIAWDGKQYIYTTQRSEPARKEPRTELREEIFRALNDVEVGR